MIQKCKEVPSTREMRIECICGPIMKSTGGYRNFVSSTGTL